MLDAIVKVITKYPIVVFIVFILLILVILYFAFVYKRESASSKDVEFDQLVDQINKRSSS